MGQPDFQPLPSAGGGDAPRDFIPAHLDAELGGSLPCAFCGYELKGLSIRSVCPECGTAVRATILYKVDPQAEEFQPIRFPRLTANALIIWSVGGLLTALCFWFMRFNDLLEVLNVSSGSPIKQWAGRVAVASATASGAALIPLIRPTRTIPKWKSVAALAAFVSAIPLVWGVWKLVQRDSSAMASMPYFEAPADPARHWLRVIIGLALIGVLLGFRPVARELVRRSLALRTGRVDRQTILGMAITLVIVAIGDVMALCGVGIFGGGGGGGSGIGAALPLISSVVIAVGSVIVTLGLISALIDSLRIGRAIIVPSPSLKQVIEGDAHDSRTRRDTR